MPQCLKLSTIIAIKAASTKFLYLYLTLYCKFIPSVTASVLIKVTDFCLIFSNQFSIEFASFAKISSYFATSGFATYITPLQIIQLARFRISADIRYCIFKTVAYLGCSLQSFSNKLIPRPFFSASVDFTKGFNYQQSPIMTKFFANKIGPIAIGSETWEASSIMQQSNLIQARRLLFTCKHVAAKM